ncbi:MAG: hypothetical protein JNM78_09280 [Cyclobacteriaceae bacterium]|nr:hypothetical protein [Cyclobacteriaceae bacterium]
MQLAPITLTERKILKAMLAGLFFLPVVMAVWIIYILFSGSFEPATLAFPILLFVIIAGLLLVKGIRIYSDIVAQQIVEGIGEIKYLGRNWGNEYYIKMDVFGKEKITLQRNGYAKLITGTKIKFRVAPKSRVLLDFETAY